MFPYPDLESLFFPIEQYKIQTPFEKDKELKLNLHQKEFLHFVNNSILHNHFQMFCLKPRQVGITTATLAFLHYDLSMHLGQQVFYISNNSTASKISNNIFAFFGKNYKKQTTSYIEFKNGSKINFYSGKDKSLLQHFINYRPNFIVLDECCWMENEVFENLFSEEIKKERSVLAFSTPNYSGPNDVDFWRNLWDSRRPYVNHYHLPASSETSSPGIDERKFRVETQGRWLEKQEVLKVGFEKQKIEILVDRDIEITIKQSGNPGYKISVIG